MLVNHVLHIDLTKPGFRPGVAAVQGEANTRQLTVSLFCNSVAWDIPEGATAAVAFLKPDGTKGLYDKLPNGSPATIMSGNTVTAILAPQALTCAGTVLASVVFYDQDLDTLATFPFRITVEKNPAAGEQISNNYYALQNLDQVNEAYTDLLSRVESLEKNGGGSGGAIPDEQIAAAVNAYLKEHPVTAGATAEEAAQIEQNRENIDKLNTDKLDADKLPEAVNEALALASASGAFKGEPGEPGKDYNLTEADKQEIAELTASLVDVPTDDHINSLINTALGVIENGTY